MSKQNEKPVEKNRRQALKAITAVSGGIVAANWSKPVVESVILPAHAQTSPAVGVVAMMLTGSGGAASSGNN